MTEQELSKAEIEEIGESFDVADDANIPVYIFLEPEKDDKTGEPTGYFTLTASDYQPRRSRIDEEMFAVRSQDPDQLRRIVAEKIIPLYQTALSRLEAIVAGKEESLYYWLPPKSTEKPE